MTTIHKAPTDWAVPPNFVDYDATRSAFDWSDQPNLCDGMGAGLYNMGYAAVDRHAVGANAMRTALRFVSRSSWDGVIATRDLTYTELGSLARSFTNVLRALAIGDELRTALMAHARRQLGAAVAAKEIQIVDSLPHTRSGTLPRRLLRARELGLPSGDVSTVEPDSHAGEATP